MAAGRGVVFSTGFSIGCLVFYRCFRLFYYLVVLVLMVSKFVAFVGLWWFSYGCCLLFF